MSNGTDTFFETFMYIWQPRILIYVSIQVLKMFVSSAHRESKSGRKC